MVLFDSIETTSQLTIKSAVVIRSTLVSRAFNINLKQRPISFLEILLIAHISVDKT